MLSYTRTYMTHCMIAAIAILMLLYTVSQQISVAILIGSVAVFVIFFTLLRNQTAISYEQRMQGMIPHHSSAIMNSQNACLKDPEAIELARDIIEAQKREIAQMKKILYRLEGEQ